MPYNCAIGSCRNYSTKVKKEHGVTYHRFPAKPKKLEVWLRIVRKSRNDPDYVPGDSARVCSAHFEDYDFVITNAGYRRLSKNADPRVSVAIEPVKVPAKESSYYKTKLKKLETRERKQHIHITRQREEILWLRKKNATLIQRNKALIEIVKDLKRVLAPESEENSENCKAESEFKKESEVKDLRVVRPFEESNQTEQHNSQSQPQNFQIQSQNFLTQHQNTLTQHQNPLSLTQSHNMTLSNPLAQSHMTHSNPLAQPHNMTQSNPLAQPHNMTQSNPLAQPHNMTQSHNPLAQQHSHSHSIYMGHSLGVL